MVGGWVDCSTGQALHPHFHSRLMWGSCHLLQAVFFLNTLLRAGPCNELFECTEGYLIHYALLLLIAWVPQAQLRTWSGALSFDGSLGKPVLPCNVHCHLEGYFCLFYESLTPMTEILTAINKLLCM